MWSRDKKSFSSGGHDVSGALCMSLSCGGTAEESNRFNNLSIASNKILALWSPKSDEFNSSPSLTIRGISERERKRKTRTK